MEESLRVSQRTEDAGAPLRLVFKGSTVKQLLNSGRKQQSTAWQAGGLGGQQQDAASPSPGAVVSDSPGLPFSPSSAEASPGPPADGAAGPRGVHGRPPGKQPYPHDRTPEAEAVRASQPPQLQPGAAAEDAAAAVAAAGGSDGGGAAPPAGPRSVHGQPPGKQPHPDDPHFGGGDADSGGDGGAAGTDADAGQGGGGDGAAGGGAGPRDVHGRPPGKQPQQVALIAQAYQGYSSEEEEPLSPPAAAAGAAQHAPWQQQHAAAQAYAPAPTASSHGAAPGPAAGASRKRPASQPGGEGGQRKRAANGGAAAGAADSPTLQRLPTGISSSHRGYSTGVPASLARTSSFHGGDAGGAQQIRPLAGAPRSLQQRQQLAAANGSGGGARQPAGASRPKQPAGGAAKPKQAAKAASSGQRKSAGGAPALPAAQYKPGDVVWAKIGVYPWWPAQLQRPTSDEHFRPKHAASDLFCVFYGSNDYNWLPASALKPFREDHPDYLRHAAVKNKALQKAIDEAWVYGVQRQRPDVNYRPYGGGT